MSKHIFNQYPIILLMKAFLIKKILKRQLLFKPETSEM